MRIKWKNEKLIMKNVIGVFVFLIFTSVMPVHSSQNNADFEMPFFNNACLINIDGQLNEYTGFPCIRLRPNNSNNLTLGSIDDSLDCSACIWLLCDQDNLYFAGRITDDSIINNMNSESIWDGDAVLFYFGFYNQLTINSPHTNYQTGNEPDYQFGISCTGLTYLWRWQIGENGTPIPDCQVATIHNNDNWTFELKCPFSGLAQWANSEYEPEPGMILPFNMVIEEDDDGTGRNAQLYWMNNPDTENSHERPDVWGRQVVISEVNSTPADKPVITQVSLSSDIIYAEDIINIATNVFCDESISIVKCCLASPDGQVSDNVELVFNNNNRYENTWVAPSVSEQSVDVQVDIIAVDTDGDSTQINNAESFKICTPVFSPEGSYEGDSYKVFDDSDIAEIRIAIEQDSLEKLFAPGNEGNYDYYPANFSFKNGNIPLTTISNIGLRLRGAIPRYSQKRDFKISFNEFQPGRNFYGLKKFNLRALNRDPGIIREKICLDLLKDINVVSARSSYVKLFINDEYRGLYLNVEEVDIGFLNAHFGNSSGNLYKCARSANLQIREDENYKFTFGPPPYAPHQIVRAYLLITNENEDDYSDLTHLIEVINNTPENKFKNEIEKIFNVHSFLKAQAVCVMVGDWDGFWSNQNNYYLYYNTWFDRFEYIPRDLDLTLGVDWGGGEYATSDIYNFGPLDDASPLMKRLFNIPEYRGEYSMYIQQIINSHFSIGELWPRITAIKTMIQSAAEDDPYRSLDYGWSINDFNQSYNEAPGTFHAIGFAAPFDLVTRIPYGLKPFIEIRTSTALNQLDMSHMPPVISNVSHIPVFPGNQDSVTITAVVTSYTGIGSVILNYNTGNGFQSLEMFDDGRHNDGEPEDQIYGTLTPPYPNIKKVDYYISAQGNSVDDICVAPENAPYSTYYYAIEYKKPSIVINEFMAVNENTIKDEAGEYDDWLELYNTGSDTVQLGGMYLTDNIQNMTKWQIPDIQIAPGEFLLFWADKDQEQSPMHTNFKLSGDGEEIGLFDTDENSNIPVDFLSFISQNENESYGRFQDGEDEWRIFVNATPGNPNDGTSTQIDESIKKSSAISHFELYQNHPNPFNSATTFRFKIPEASHVVLKIYNLLGREKETVLDKQLEKGDYKITYTARDMSSGIYFLHLKTDKTVEVNKFILLK